MHVLAVNSVSTLLNFLTEQLAQTPAEAEIKTYNEVIIEDEEQEDEVDKEMRLQKWECWGVICLEIDLVWY